MSSPTNKIAQPVPSKEAIRGAIQIACFDKTLTIRQIALKFNVTVATVMKWKKRSFVTDAVRNRKTKLKSKHIEFIKKMADGKYTGIEQASSRQIAYKLQRKFNRNLKKMVFTICHSTVNKVLNKVLCRPRKAKTTFKLTDQNKDKRIELIQWVKDNNVKGKDIFFTDESRFLLDTPLNAQTNQIRFNKEDEMLLKSGDTKIYEKVHKPVPKYTSGFMVAGGMSTHGLGKLIFCVGTMNTFAYRRTLDYFQEDVNRLNSDLYFQQDGASCHTGNKSIEHIGTLFNNKLPFWPANSPDLSPIEMIWALLKQKLQEKKHNTLEELKAHLIFLWNRVPIGLCKKLIAQFDRKIKIIENSGERINLLPKKKKKFVLKKRL
jgi:transposase